MKIAVYLDYNLAKTETNILHPLRELERFRRTLIVVREICYFETY